ncbi:hypothetical protein GQ600_4464 [Phytophthora cactorum]|nr:hypothetical protein GQ600_4464 [Phytophthora cactorum]
MRNPVLILDAFYILPSKLLDHCMPIRNTRQNPVLVDARGHDSYTRWSCRGDQIKDVGFFTREQIEIMRRVENLKSTVQLGLDSHKWLSEEALPALVLNITRRRDNF